MCHWLCQCFRVLDLLGKHWPSQWHPGKAKLLFSFQSNRHVMNPSQAWSWRPEPTPPVRSARLQFDPVAVDTRADETLLRTATIKLSRPATLLKSPGIVSLPIRPAVVRTFGFCFPQTTDEVSPVIPPISKTRATTATPLVTAHGKAATRIDPPGDVIRLQDRLYYMLQPSLETMIDGGELRFPFEPFAYQYEGIAFLYPRYSAIIADEMGLGKTMQAIAAIRLLLHTGELRSILLICPKPLVTNWQREFAMWAPEIPIMAVEGDQARRHWQWRQAEPPVKIANYEAVVRDRNVFSDAALHFDLVVLDEAQRIKNRHGTTSEVVRCISRNRNWALTGTPVENSPEDLVGIFEFLSPGFLSSHMKPRAMGRAARDHILRRTKDEVLTDLPPKLVRDAELTLTPPQRESYEMAEEQGIVRLTEMGEGATIQHVFQLVLRLKQICNFDPATGASSKLERLHADMEEVAASGQKAIVFSQWVKTLLPLRRELAEFGPLEYHGKIPSKRRDGVLKQFQEDPNCNVLLMSYGAGAVGLNLQFAGYVFLFDRWWNPAIEDQAINRAHRIGAAGPVTVTRFLMAGTIEERIDQILQEKRELFDTILSDAGPTNSGLSRAEIFGLFKLRRKPAAQRRAA